MSSATASQDQAFDAGSAPAFAACGRWAGTKPRPGGFQGWSQHGSGVGEALGRGAPVERSAWAGVEFDLRRSPRLIAGRAAARLPGDVPDRGLLPPPASDSQDQDRWPGPGPTCRIPAVTGPCEPRSPSQSRRSGAATPPGTQSLPGGVPMPRLSATPDRNWCCEPSEGNCPQPGRVVTNGHAQSLGQRESHAQPLDQPRQASWSSSWRRIGPGGHRRRWRPVQEHAEVAHAERPRRSPCAAQ
jgi:hypothetical protein